MFLACFTFGHIVYKLCYFDWFFDGKFDISAFTVVIMLLWLSGNLMKMENKNEKMLRHITENEKIDLFIFRWIASPLLAGSVALASSLGLLLHYEKKEHYETYMEMREYKEKYYSLEEDCRNNLEKIRFYNATGDGEKNIVLGDGSVYVIRDDGDVVSVDEVKRQELGELERIMKGKELTLSQEKERKMDDIRDKYSFGE